MRKIKYSGVGRPGTGFPLADGAELCRAYLTAESERWRLVHVSLGYTMGGLVAFRMVWGLMGTRYARFQFLCAARPRSCAMCAPCGRQPEHHVGHNPAGAVAIVLMLLLSDAVRAASLRQPCGQRPRRARRGAGSPTVRGVRSGCAHCSWRGSSTAAREHRERRLHRLDETRIGQALGDRLAILRGQLAAGHIGLAATPPAAPAAHAACAARPSTDSGVAPGRPSRSATSAAASAPNCSWCESTPVPAQTPSAGGLLVRKHSEIEADQQRHCSGTRTGRSRHGRTAPGPHCARSHPSAMRSQS